MSQYRTDTYYRQAVKTLRKVAHGFGTSDGYDLRNFHNWTPAQKSKLSRYYKEYWQLTAKPHKVIYNLRPDRLKKVQDYSGQQLKKGFKAAIVPVISENHSISIKVPDNGPVQVIENGRVFEDIPLDKKKLAKNPEGYLAEILTGRRDEFFFVEAADNQTTRYGGRNGDLIRVILQLMEQYSEQNKSHPQNPKDRNSHHWKNWLIGLRATGAKNLSGFAKLQRELLEQRKINRKLRQELYEEREQEEKEILTYLISRIQKELPLVQRKMVRERLSQMTKQKKSMGEKIQYLQQIFNPRRSWRGGVGKRVR